MLQQTQVERVVPHYERFAAAFPTPAACARAGPAAVVRSWSGLGYNRRALNLHRAAGSVVADHGGACRGSDAALRALAGVGPYTARAVRSFAFGDDVAAVDTNAVRVLARAVAGRPLTPALATRLGDRLVPAGLSWEFNQTMFDLGSDGVPAPRTGLRARAPCAASVSGAAPGRSGPVATEPDGAAPERVRRLGPAGEGAIGRGVAPGRGTRSTAGRGLRLARRTGPGAAGGARHWWTRALPAGPGDRAGSCGSAEGAPARRSRHGRADHPVKKVTMRRLTTSGLSRWRKWPAPSTISISEPSARKSRGDPMDESSMQPSSRPCR